MHTKSSQKTKPFNLLVRCRWTGSVFVFHRGPEISFRCSDDRAVFGWPRSSTPPICATQTVAQRRAAAGDRTNHHLAEQALRLGSHLPGSLQHSPMLHNDGNLVCSRVDGNLNGKPFDSSGERAVPALQAVTTITLPAAPISCTARTTLRPRFPRPTSCCSRRARTQLLASLGKIEKVKKCSGPRSRGKNSGLAQQGRRPLLITGWTTNLARLCNIFRHPTHCP